LCRNRSREGAWLFNETGNRFRSLPARNRVERGRFLRSNG
jgi:hypothetical protein